MRKGFTLVELLIVAVIVGVMGLVLYANVNRFLTDRTCTQHGYTIASRNSYNKFCTKVVNGNTIVVHADSLR